MKKILLFIGGLTLSFSCVEDDAIISDSASVLPLVEEKCQVLKERNSDEPWVQSDYVSKTKSVFDDNTLRYSGIPNRNLLGYSLKNDVYPLEDMRNLGNYVVDIEKLSRDYPSYVRAWKVTTGDASYFSYANFDRYLTKSTIIENVSKGFSLNLGLFSIGNKKSYKNVFSSSLVENSNSTFGELNVVLRDSPYRLQNSSEIINKIKTSYLSKDFEEELYNTHPSELFQNYGGFVLTEFVTGGKATALYIATAKKNESSETKESNMDKELSASFKFNQGQNTSSNLSLGRGNSSDTQVSVTNEFNSISMSIKTFGGNSSFASFSVPKEVNSTNVDLTSWVTSLNDKTTHSIIEFGIAGLVPIYEYVVEENLKNHLLKYYESGVTKSESLQEPYISIQISYQRQMLAIGTYLHTRFGDDILLKNALVGSTTDPKIAEKMDEYLQVETERVSNMFGVRIVSLLSVNSNTENENKTMFDIDNFVEPNLKKYEYNGAIYLISTSVDYKGSAIKKALSIHNDRFISEYAMRNLINRLPSINMDYSSFIREYTIYAL